MCSGVETVLFKEKLYRTYVYAAINCMDLHHFFVCITVAQ